MLKLFDNRLAPLTYSLGFLNADAAQLVDAIRSFLAGVPNVPTKVSRLTGSLEENLLRLQPLIIGGKPPLLVTSTRLDGWAAVFDGHAHGHGVENRVSHMVGVMGISGYFVAAAPRTTGPTSGLGGKNSMFWDLKPNSAMFVRSP